MGKAVSKNVSDTAVDITFKITNSFVQDVTTYARETNKITIDKCKDVTVEHVKEENYATVDLEAFQSAEIQAAMSADIQQALEQYAKSMTQWLGFFEKSDAENFSKQVIQLGFTIANKFSQTCATIFTQKNAITCKDSQGVTIKFVDLINALFDVEECTVEDTIVEQQRAEIRQSVEQTAKARQANYLTGVISLVALIIGGIAIYGVTSTKSPGMITFALIAIAIIIATLVGSGLIIL